MTHVPVFFFCASMSRAFKTFEAAAMFILLQPQIKEPAWAAAVQIGYPGKSIYIRKGLLQSE